MIKISIDCRYVRARPSGIGHYVASLIRRVPALAPADHFHLWTDPTAPVPLTSYPHVTETVVRAPANSLRTLLWNGRLANRMDSDVHHAPFNILGRGVSCPTVVTIHDLIWLLTPSAPEGRSWRTPFQALLFRDGILRAIRCATRIISISQATADAILRVDPGAGRRLRVIPLGVENRFLPAADLESARVRAARLIGTENPFFLVVGQNAPFKNHAQILEAFAAADLGERYSIVLVQRLYAKGDLAKRARRLGIEDQVIWLKTCGEEELVLLYQAALALIQFSLFEGFGLPVLEAMACGTPVVASSIPPLIEVLGGAGYLVPLDLPPLVQAFRRLAEDSAFRLELKGRGMERARSFSWDLSAARHLEVYREAVER